MAAALTRILDSYLMPLESPTRAYLNGTGICYNYLLAHNDRNKHVYLTHLKKHPLEFVFETISTLSLTFEANRLKIFKGTRWEILFMGSILGLASFNTLAFASNYFNTQLPWPLNKISNASWQQTPAIKCVTMLAFSILAFYRRPIEASLCLLGGCVVLIGFNQNTSKAVKSRIDNINHCLRGIRFYVGSGYERAIIIGLYLNEMRKRYYGTT